MKTVRDFIEKLLLLDPDMPLFVSGYEYGFDFPAKLRRVNVAVNPSPKGDVGKYLLLADTVFVSGVKANPETKIFTAYVLPRPKTCEFFEQESKELE